MDANREVIRRQDLHHHYLRRSEVVEAIYDDYQAQYGTPFECRLLPSLMDLCSLPELKEQIEADADDSFSDIEDRLPALILACEERLKREAQTVLLESCQTIDLDLAISVLHCTQCAGLLFGSTEMLRQHGCRRFYPKSNNRYECPPLLLECVAQVIRSAGLDLATATIEDMDRSNVFFSCSTHPLHMIRGSRSTDFYSWRSYVRILSSNRISIQYCLLTLTGQPLCIQPTQHKLPNGTRSGQCLRCHKRAAVFFFEQPIHLALQPLSSQSPT